MPLAAGFFISNSLLSLVCSPRHGFLKFVLYQKFTAENAGFAEFFKFFSAFFALSAVKALFVSTLRKPCSPRSI